MEKKVFLVFIATPEPIMEQGENVGFGYALRQDGVFSNLQDAKDYVVLAKKRTGKNYKIFKSCQ